MPIKKLEIIPVPVSTEITIDDDIVNLLLRSVNKIGSKLIDKDILVIAQKIISKQEGRFVNLRDITPSQNALEINKYVNKDPRLIEVILRESKQIVRIFNNTIIAETKQGFICANAGVDRSNVCKDGNIVLLLPKNPDKSAEKIRQEIEKKIGKKVAVIVSDTFGRPFRNGQTNVAIGISGIKPIKSYVGKIDMYGHPLRVTEIAIADELAGASELVMGKSDYTPFSIIRGFSFSISKKSNGEELKRKKKFDKFRGELKLVL